MTPTRYVMVLESDAHDDGVQYVAPSLERAVEFVRTVLTIAQPGDGFDQTGPVGVPMCEACANAVLARHPLHDEEEAT
jgi:hypothetical protein